jgi:hypothetical protein
MPGVRGLLLLVLPTPHYVAIAENYVLFKPDVKTAGEHVYLPNEPEGLKRCKRPH